MPTILDSFPYGGDATRWLNITLKSQLIDYDTKLPGDGCDKVASSADVVGSLADSYTVSGDRKVITLKLRDTKSAYGNPLTAKDVKWSFARILALGSFMSNTLGKNGHYDLENFVDVVDDKTIRINVTKPFSFEVALLTNNLLMVWDSTEAKKHATKKDPWSTKWMATHTADFGPWKLQSFTPGSEVVFVPNPGYTGERGNVKRLVMRAVPDASVRTQLLQAGDAQIATRLSYDEYAQLADSGSVTQKKCVVPNRDFLILNHKDPALGKTEVRRAISMAIDRAALVQSAYHGFGSPATLGLSQHLAFPKPPADKQLTYDPDAAKKLLAEAGYPNGLELTLLYSDVRPGSVVHQSAPVLQAMLQKVGIKLKLKNVAGSADFYTNYSQGKYQAVLYSEGSPLSDPTYAASTFLATGGNDNSFGYSSKLFDSTLEQAKGLTPGAEQGPQLQKMAEVIVDEMPLVPLVDQVSAAPLAQGVTGYRARPQGEYVPSDLSVK
ncbi:ABC transporter substrate-binding protein [Patulibacter defluvii]|uniref:ABC transporter substrate-binding protein n=1 Tax=Patulibacter defluvii TaxID=3095358 RepID=UPI002A75BB76|nr:ABC transporter substrate-binding protein [Patulibacter sp. DM4]